MSHMLNMTDEIGLKQAAIKAESEHLTGYSIISQGLTAVNDTCDTLKGLSTVINPLAVKILFVALQKRRVLPMTASVETKHR